MDSAQEFSREIVKATKDEIVEFKFKSKTKDGQEEELQVVVVRFLKSLLAASCPAFQAMFSDPWDKNGSIEMEDDVDFDEADVFSRFVLIVSKVLKVEQMSVQTSCACYFYAEKYQIDDLKSDLLNHISGCKHAFKLDEITDCLALAELYQLIDFKAKLNSIKLGLKEELAIGFFDVCSKYQMEKLMDQLVTFLSKKPLHISWPFDLIVKIVDKGRKDAEELEERLERMEKLMKEHFLVCKPEKESENTVESVFQDIIDLKNPFNGTI